MLGQALIKELKSRKEKVIGIARKKADICIDIMDSVLLLETIKDINPSVIINAVAIVDLVFCEENPCLSYLCNAKTSGILSRYCALNDKKYIYISTDHYFTGDKEKKHTEEDPVNLCNEYATTKYLGEKLSLISDNSLVVRTNIVGFRYRKERPTFLEWAITSLEKKEPIKVFIDFYTSGIDVQSFSKSLCDLIDIKEKGIINLASSEVSNKKQFIEAIAKRLDLSTENTKPCLMKQSNTNIERNESLGLSVLKAERVLGYSLPSLADVVDSLAKEYIQGGQKYEI